MKILISIFNIFVTNISELWLSLRAGVISKLRQSTDNIICLSHLPARWGCVCVCVKSLGISPSSHRPFKCMRQYHTILAGGGEMRVNYQNKKVEGWQRTPLNLLILSVCLFDKDAMWKRIVMPTHDL